MKIIKSASDLEQIRNHHLHDTIKEIISPYIDDPEYRPQDDGYVALLEPDDVDRVLSDLDMPWRLPLRFVGCPHEHPKKYRLR
jgi:hypothetical protein